MFQVSVKVKVNSLYMSPKMGTDCIKVEEERLDGLSVCPPFNSVLITWNNIPKEKERERIAPSTFLRLFYSSTLICKEKWPHGFIDPVYIKPQTRWNKPYPYLISSERRLEMNHASRCIRIWNGSNPNPNCNHDLWHQQNDKQGPPPFSLPLVALIRKCNRLVR